MKAGRKRRATHHMFMTLCVRSPLTSSCTWPGSYTGVPDEFMNYTVSEEHYMKAYDLGHYKAPLMVGLGTAWPCENCLHKGD